MSRPVLASIGRRLSLQELKVLLLEHVSRKRPASVIRFNDGEGKLVGCGAHYGHSALMQMLDRWFADNLLTLDQLHRFQSVVAEATLNADVVGSPDENWPDEFARANAVLADLAGDRGLQTALVNFPQAMILDGFFQTLLNRIGFLGLITSRDVRGVVRHLFNPGELAWYPVPEQAIYAYRPSLPRHFPDVFDFLCSRIHVPHPGALFLVGAGPCGKVYCDVIKRNGGIAIDIGSVFDLWAGRLTRPDMSFDSVRGYYERVVAVPSPREPDVLALAEIHQNSGDVGRSIDLLRMALRIRPGSVALALKAAECLLLVGDALSAKGVYEALMQPGHCGCPEMRAFARLFRTHGQADYAAEILAEALYLDPTDLVMLRMALQSFIDPARKPGPNRTRFRDDLLAAARLAAASAPGDHALLFNLARYLGSTGHVEEAARWGGKAIALFPVQPAYYQPAIEWNSYLGRQEEAAGLRERLAGLDQAD
jgi:tetratricopeptide (TPR) repeat protein